MPVLKKFLASLTQLFQGKKKGQRKGRKARTSSSRPRRRKVPGKTRRKAVSKKKNSKRKAKSVRRPKKTPVRRRFVRRKRLRPKKRIKRVVVRRSSVPKRRTISKSKRTLPSKGSSSPGEFIGEITHFFSKIQVVVLKVEKAGLRAGDQIHIVGKSTDFRQRVNSMQIESVDVKVAPRGSVIGVKVNKPAREGDKVYRVS